MSSRADFSKSLNSNMPPVRELFLAKERFPDIPFEAILKTDLLRQGVSFSRKALEVCKGAKPISYFIFSFDRAEQKDLSEMERRSVPEEIALIGGPYDLKRTIVSVRVNPKSPYGVGVGANLVFAPTEAGRSQGSPLQINYNNEPICDVRLPTF